MSFVEKYRAIKARENEEHRRRHAEDSRLEAVQTEEILNVIMKTGVQRDQIETNGYWFHFPYKGMWISFVNQSRSANRVCVEVHRLPRNDEEKAVLEDAHRITSRENELAEEFRREFMYEDFILYGKPASSVSQILMRAEQLSHSLPH